MGHQGAYGPDLPWTWHRERLEEVLQPGWGRLPAHRWHHLQYSDQVDRDYMLLCLAAESVLASRQCLGFRAAAFHCGWPVQTKVLGTPSGGAQTARLEVPTYGPHGLVGAADTSC